MAEWYSFFLFVAIHFWFWRIETHPKQTSYEIIKRKHKVWLGKDRNIIDSLIGLYVLEWHRENLYYSSKATSVNSYAAFLHTSYLLTACLSVMWEWCTRGRNKAVYVWRETKVGTISHIVALTYYEFWKVLVTSPSCPGAKWRSDERGTRDIFKFWKEKCLW